MPRARSSGSIRAPVIDSVLAALRDRLEEPDSQKPESLYATARWKVDGETIVVAISEPKSGSTLASPTRSRIADGATLGTARERLRDILDHLAR